MPNLLLILLLFPVVALGCPSSPQAIRDELHQREGRDVVSDLWDSGECENYLLDQISLGTRDWLEIALILEPYADAAAGETLLVALSAAMQKAPSRVLPLVKRSRFGNSLCVPVSYDDSPGFEERFLRELKGARRMYESFRSTTLWPIAQACLVEVSMAESRHGGA
jgi:hypothetical protein